MIDGISSILAYIFVTILAVVFYGKWKRGSFKGPLPLPIIGNFLVFIGHTDRVIYRLLELTEKYGGTCLIWMGSRRLFFTGDADHAQVYFTSVKMLDHSFVYDNYKIILGNGLFTANGSKWKMTRRQIAPSFNPSILRNYVQNFKKNADILVDVLDKHADGPSFKALPYFGNYAIDGILENFFEYEYNCQAHNKSLTQKAKLINELLFKRYFNIFCSIEWIYYLTANGKEFNKVRSEVYELADDILSRKRRDVANEKVEDGSWRKNAFIHKLFNRDLSHQQLRDEVCTLVVAGIDTIANTVAFIIHLVGMHPEIQEKMVDEDAEIMKRLAGRELEWEDLKYYEYTERVIKESMRLIPVAAMLSRVASDNVRLGNYTIPKGCGVVFLVHRLHRDPKHFPNPLTFNPDNFLPEVVAKRHPYAYIPFALGPRNCIGTKYAMMSLMTVVPAIIRNYRVISTLKDVNNINLNLEVTVKDADGCMIRLEKRTRTE